MGIFIGERCLLSNGIGIYSTDFHSVYNKSNNRYSLNSDKDITIENYVCLGLKLLFKK